MKNTLLRYFFLLLLLCGLLFFIFSSKLEADYYQPYDYQHYEQLPDILQSEGLLPPPALPPTRPAKPSGRHTSTRASATITPEKLSAFLGQSPLASYSETILQSPHWSTIIGICWIEQYHCQHAPGNNYWGIGGANGLKTYATPEAGIQAISSLLEYYDLKGKDTIEELNGFYVQPASDNWYKTVVKIKLELENN